VSKKRILYISSNDGSDTRINKEVKTLSVSFDIDFIGIGLPEKAFAKDYCKKFILVPRSRKSILAWLEVTILAYRLTITNKYHSIHLINEQL
jgi:hypothetical protein